MCECVRLFFTIINVLKIVKLTFLFSPKDKLNQEGITPLEFLVVVVVAVGVGGDIEKTTAL